MEKIAGQSAGRVCFVFAKKYPSMSLGSLPSPQGAGDIPSFYPVFIMGSSQ